MTVKTDKQALNDLMDIKEFESLRSRAMAHITARQWGIYKDIEKWKAMDASLSLEQEQIDSVIQTQEKQAEMFDYMYNVILNDKQE